MRTTAAVLRVIGMVMVLPLGGALVAFAGHGCQQGPVLAKIDRPPLAATADKAQSAGDAIRQDADEADAKTAQAQATSADVARQLQERAAQAKVQATPQAAAFGDSLDAASKQLSGLVVPNLAAVRTLLGDIKERAGVIVMVVAPDVRAADAKWTELEGQNAALAKEAEARKAEVTKLKSQHAGVIRWILGCLVGLGVLVAAAGVFVAIKLDGTGGLAMIVAGVALAGVAALVDLALTWLMIASGVAIAGVVVWLIWHAQAKTTAFTETANLVQYLRDKSATVEQDLVAIAPYITGPVQQALVKLGWKKGDIPTPPADPRPVPGATTPPPVA